MLTNPTIAQNPNFHIYLCFGQSNMEGSAEIEEQDKMANSRFKVLQSLDCENYGFTKNEWRIATPPLSQCYTGLSPADYFGKTMIEYLPDSITIGIINVAVGGSDIRLFDKAIHEDFHDSYKEEWFRKKIQDYGNNPYQHLINLGKLAQKDGIIKGFLLHQGETNAGDEQWPVYVKTVYKNLLSDLNLKAKSTPLIAGKLVHADQDGICAHMNPIIDKLPQYIPTAHIVESKDCSVREDNVHFNSKGVRELGKRYAETILKVQYDYDL